MGRATDLGAIVDVLPNVGINGAPRAVDETIRIRGLSDERILLLIDGIKQNFAVGHMGSGFISPGLIESVEVERGPASVLWGSGAIGGVVSVDTKEAADLLADDQVVGALLHGGFQSATDGWITNGAVYGRLGDNVDALLQLGRSSFENVELGNGEALPFSGYRRTSVLAKATWSIAPGNALQFSHRYMDRNGISDINPREKREIAVGASRVEWTWVPATSKLVDLTLGLSHSRTEAHEITVGGHSDENTLVSSYQMDVANTSRFDLGMVGHHVLTYGFDMSHGSVEATLNGQPRSLIPDGERLIAGAFVQDEIHWNSAWTTTFGLRYDYYQSESGAAATLDHENKELSAQIGLLWQPTDWLQLYASYAEAFRAPSISELFTAGPHSFVFVPPAPPFFPGARFGFDFVANPQLQPERAANKEIGVRTEWHGLFAQRDRLQFELAAFHNDVENFISPKALNSNAACAPAFVLLPGSLPTCTFKNITDAELEGFEAEIYYATDAWFVGVSYGQTRGHNQTRDHDLSGMPADTWVVRAGVTALPWDGRIAWRMTHAETQDRVAPSEPATEGYTVHDLLTSWHPTPDLRVDFGIGNVTDREYRAHNSVAPGAGRNFKLGVTWKF